MASCITRSRAFWNLRAEQVMDQVFMKSDSTLHAVRVAVDPDQPPRRNENGTTRQQQKRNGLLISATVMAGVGLSSSLWLAHNWQRSLQALNRERDLQMIERLRHLPVNTQANQASKADTAPAPANAANADAVPTIASAELQPLTIPLAGTLPIPNAIPSPEEDAALLMAPAEPLLVGVVHAGGGQGSAIFQLDQLSLSASPGEAIGNSGWQLRSVQTNGAVIERDGDVRNLSVGGAF
ncbi:hypothetical protein [Synechococcus sp. MIT S9451]|uniref:hypothetical protein n=1 Tax=Synechococcus sp. MIT S9451 TaxID=3082543 RepID=UPI0039B40C38